MGMYVFTYNASNQNFESQDIRRVVIRWLVKNKATHIGQCLDTTFVFRSVNNLQYWRGLIAAELDVRGGVLQGAFYLINRVFYTEQGRYQIHRNCNPDLNDFVRDVIGQLPR